MVTVSWFAGVPTVILSPTTKPVRLPRARTMMVVAPAIAFAESCALLDCVPTLVTVTVSIP